MEILQNYLDSPRGVSLRADNNKYLSRINYTSSGGVDRIEAAKSTKDPFTTFLITKTTDGKRIMLKADNGKYWSLILRGSIYFVEAAKTTPDVFCEFEPFDVDGKLVLRGQNMLFVSRINRSGVDNIESAKTGIDTYCRFVLEDGGT